MVLFNLAVACMSILKQPNIKISPRVNYTLVEAANKKFTETINQMRLLIFQDRSKKPCAIDLRRVNNF
jgi:hypothetical protein